MISPRSIHEDALVVAPLHMARSNERGAALIIVLIMMLLLTILGSTLLTSSTTDLQIAGNYRNNQEAFYINDFAYEFLKSEESTADVYDKMPQPDDVIKVTKKLPPDPVTGLEAPVTYTVTNVGCLGGAPPGSGGDSDTGNAYNVYAIDISAEGPNHAAVTTLAGNLYQRGKPCD